MIAENRRVRAHIDYPLIIMSLCMAVFGVLAVTVATFSPGDSPDASLLNHIAESTFAVRQCIFLVLAPIILTVLCLVPYGILKRYTFHIYLISILLVTVVWVFNRAAGVKQWLDVLWGFTIQPTEFAKLAMILMLARNLSAKEQPMSNMKEIIRNLVIMAVPAAIIVLSGEMGSLLVIVFFWAVMLFFANVPLKVLVFFGLTGAVLIAGLIAFVAISGADSYRFQRLVAFVNPEAYSLGDAYQQRLAKMAIGSGGFTGVGLFKEGAIYQLNYVPADWTDMILATIGEAFGFVGCIGILLGYLLIILRMLYLARYTRDKYGMLVIIGVMAMLLFHVFENMGMALGLMPITGIPLPFLSYGGSNMVTNMGGIGLVLNVTKNRSLNASFLTPQVSQSAMRYSRPARF